MTLKIVITVAWCSTWHKIKDDMMGELKPKRRFQTFFSDRKVAKTQPCSEQNLTHFDHNLIPKATAFNLNWGKKPNKTLHTNHRKENIQVITTNILMLRKNTRRTSVPCFHISGQRQYLWEHSKGYSPIPVSEQLPWRNYIPHFLAITLKMRRNKS